MECLICERESDYWRTIAGTPTYRCAAGDCGFRFFDLARWHSPYIGSDYYEDWPADWIDPTAPYIRARVDLLRRFKTAGSVAELGCGIGETAVALHAGGFSVVGVDESPLAIGFLQRQYPAIDWRQADLLAFIAEHPQSFDAITLFHVLEHIPRPREAIRLVDRALRPGGIIVVEVPDASGGHARLLGRRWDYYVDHHVNYFDTTSLQKLMGLFGYRRCFLERTYHPSFPQGSLLKDVAKKFLADIGFNSIIRTGWTR